jgi:hypothetical protein
MAHINDCVPGLRARVQKAGVARVVGKVGTIVEVSRIKRKSAEPVLDTVILDIPGHGEVVVAPGDLEIVTS